MPAAARERAVRMADREVRARGAAGTAACGRDGSILDARPDGSPTGRSDHLKSKAAMAQTKKKRQTKHRGNAAGQIEARGRTGRRPTAGERRPSGRELRQARLDTPPTWRSALNRALVAAALFLALLLLFFHRQQLGPKLGIAAFMLAVYVPMGYYTDLWIYRRRQARRLREQAAKRDAPSADSR